MCIGFDGANRWSCAAKGTQAREKNAYTLWSVDCGSSANCLLLWPAAVRLVYESIALSVVGNTQQSGVSSFLGGDTVQKVLNFLQYKEQKETEQIETLFKKANSLNERLEMLLANKALHVEDHKLFLAFLAYLEAQRLQPEQVFRNVLSLPKHRFEAQYAMNWTQVVKLACTFLVILKESNREAYEAFIAT